MRLRKIQQYFSPNSILDVGANIGQFYNEIVQIFPNSKYHLIEGNSNCEPYLRTLKVPYSIALLSDVEKVCEFYTQISDPISTGNSTYLENTTFFDQGNYRVEKIMTQTLDKLFSNITFDLIKIDVQGAELDILKGGTRLVTNAKGIILEVSYSEYNVGAPKAYDVYNYMKDIGFLPATILENILHPLDNTFIQQDILFLPY